MTRAASKRLAVTALASAALLPACTTVRSTQLQTFTPSADAGGMTYLLPTRLLKVTATRTPVSLEDLRKAAAQKQTALAEAAKALQTATVTRTDAEALLGALAEDAPEDARSDATAQVATTMAREMIAKQAQAAANVAAVDAAAALATAQSSGNLCTYQAKMELLAPQGDPAHRFVARPVHNPLRDDSTAIKVTPAGLLSSTKVVAADRTGDIFVELAGAVAGFGGFPGARMLGDTPTPNCASLPRQYVGIVDPVAGPRDAAGRLAAGSAIGELNARLAAADFPIRIQVEDGALVKAAKDYRGIDIAGGVKSVRGGAIFYRTPVPVPIVVEQCLDVVTAASPCGAKRWQSVDAALLPLPQAGPVSYIPMNSSAFVKTVDDVSFQDGSIAAWTAERPSEVLEVVRLPVRVLTAIISIPAQILSLRVDYSSKEESLAAYQRKEMERDARNAELVACIRKAEAEGDLASACF